MTAAGHIFVYFLSKFGLTVTEKRATSHIYEVTKNMFLFIFFLSIVGYKNGLKIDLLESSLECLLKKWFPQNIEMNMKVKELRSNGYSIYNYTVNVRQFALISNKRNQINLLRNEIAVFLLKAILHILIIVHNIIRIVSIVGVVAFCRVVLILNDFIFAFLGFRRQSERF